ncbi:MAG: hypothetical protein K8E24_006130 [Methanobacterium paludis]|nr:hypothetical protein [Methanobacterium paludis]
MKKIIIMGLFALIIGAVPVYAADSSTTTAVQQLQNSNSSAYQDIMNTLSQIQNINPNVSQDINNLKNEFMSNPQINMIIPYYWYYDRKSLQKIVIIICSNIFKERIISLNVLNL